MTGKDRGIPKNGNLRGQLGRNYLDEMSAKVLWPMAAMHPISYAKYQELRQESLSLWSPFLNC